MADLADVVMRAGRRLRAAYTAEFEGLPLNPHQARALRAVGRLEPLRPSLLADRLHVAARSASEVADALVAGGWVARSPDPNDRRAHLLSITPAGRDLLADIEAARARAAEAVFGGLGAEQRRAAAEALAGFDGRVEPS